MCSENSHKKAQNLALIRSDNPQSTPTQKFLQNRNAVLNDILIIKCYKLLPMWYIFCKTVLFMLMSKINFAVIHLDTLCVTIIFLLHGLSSVPSAD